MSTDTGTHRPTTPETDPRGPVLLALARASLRRALGQPATGPVDTHAPWLHQPGACFVTLTQHGQLRGCIGSLLAQRPLIDDVQANAVAAALDDPRFDPLRAAELPHTRIEVSLLSPLEPMNFRDEADALAQLRPGVDGVVLSCPGHRGTFLPQVWEQLPTPVEFMAHLKRKAGLSADFWSPQIRLQRYHVSAFHEAEPT